jgi:hypothetical protein
MNFCSGRKGGGEETVNRERTQCFDFVVAAGPFRKARALLCCAVRGGGGRGYVEDLKHLMMSLFSR